jgi:hypothetical protein
MQNIPSLHSISNSAESPAIPLFQVQDTAYGLLVL